jgi:phage terminase large subunit-like protein
MDALKTTVAREIDKLSVVEGVSVAIHDRDGSLIGGSQDEVVIRQEDIHYYDEQPKSVAAMKGHGIDLGISQKEGADYTAIVRGEVFYVDDAPKIFTQPNPFNEHVTFHELLKRVREVSASSAARACFLFEDDAYEKAAIQEMKRLMLPVIPMKPQGDKRARLQVMAPSIRNGTVLFPRTGCEGIAGPDVQFGHRIARR